MTLCSPFCSEWCEIDNNAFALELRLDGATALTTQCCSKSFSTKSLLKYLENWPETFAKFSLKLPLEMSRSLLNIAKRPLPRLTLRGVSLTSKDAVS